MLSVFTWSETSPASASTAASSNPVVGVTANYLGAGVAGPFNDHEDVELIAELVGATGGTLDVYVQSQREPGEPWYDVAHFATLSAGAPAAIYRGALTQHPQSTSDAPTLIGKDLTPALAANKLVQAMGFTRLRLLMVAGSGTSAGATVTVRATGQRPYNRPNG